MMSPRKPAMPRPAYVDFQPPDPLLISSLSSSPFAIPRAPIPVLVLVRLGKEAQGGREAPGVNMVNVRPAKVSAPGAWL